MTNTRNVFASEKEKGFENRFDKILSLRAEINDNWTRLPRLNQFAEALGI